MRHWAVRSQQVGRKLAAREFLASDKQRPMPPAPLNVANEDVETPASNRAEEKNPVAPQGLISIRGLALATSLQAASMLLGCQLDDSLWLKAPQGSSASMAPLFFNIVS